MAQGAQAVSQGLDYLHVRRLPNGRTVFLRPHSFGGLVLNLGTMGAAWFDDEWHFQFEQRSEAWRAALGWDGKGEPRGWYRHPATGRRREGGDPSTEHIRF